MIIICIWGELVDFLFKIELLLWFFGSFLGGLDVVGFEKICVKVGLLFRLRCESCLWWGVVVGFWVSSLVLCIVFDSEFCRWLVFFISFWRLFVLKNSLVFWVLVVVVVMGLEVDCCCCIVWIMVVRMVEFLLGFIELFGVCGCGGLSGLLGSGYWLLKILLLGENIDCFWIVVCFCIIVVWVIICGLGILKGLLMLLSMELLNFLLIKCLLILLRLFWLKFSDNLIELNLLVLFLLGDVRVIIFFVLIYFGCMVLWIMLRFLLWWYSCFKLLMSKESFCIWFEWVFIFGWLVWIDGGMIIKFVLEFFFLVVLSGVLLKMKLLF